MATIPPDTPVTIPELLTVAIAELLLDQLPPDVPSVNVVVAPWHRWVAPVMIPADGDRFTVMVIDVIAVPQDEETV